MLRVNSSICNQFGLNEQNSLIIGFDYFMLAQYLLQDLTENFLQEFFWLSKYIYW